MVSPRHDLPVRRLPRSATEQRREDEEVASGSGCDAGQEVHDRVCRFEGLSSVRLVCQECARPACPFPLPKKKRTDGRGRLVKGFCESADELGGWRRRAFLFISLALCCLQCVELDGVACNCYDSAFIRRESLLFTQNSSLIILT